MRRCRTRTVAAAVVLAASALLVPGAVRAEYEPVAAKPQATKDLPDQAVLAEPDTMLGAGWKKSSDMLVAGSGDLDGFHLYVAREKDAFAWSTLATLNAGLPEAGVWTGNVCVTGSGRYAAVVYAPATAVNKPILMNEGGFAAIVDLRDGTATRLPERVQLAYFNPACGPDDDVLLTRAIGEHQQYTDLIGVDAATGEVTGTTRVEAQLTNPAPTPDGNLGVVGSTLVGVSESGELTELVRPGGQPFAVRATAGGAIDLLTVQRQGGKGKKSAGGERAVAYRFDGEVLTRLGDAPRTELGLFGLSGGRNLLVGRIDNVETEGYADLSAVASGQQPRAVSHQGHLLALSMLPEPRENVAADRPERIYAHPQGGSELQVTVQAVRTGRTAAGTVGTERLPATDVAPATRSRDGDSASETVRQQGHGESRPPAPGSRMCNVPRNDIDIQVPQPSANQVEWAVDQAVHGRLAVQQNGTFPLPSNYRPVPAQLMLAILAQETNLYQGSWRGVPGDAVNPLISDYYGLRADPNGRLESIDYSKADCGYGISQVTDGMGRNTSSRWTSTQQLAIATDYRANIAAGLQILVEKWHQLQAVNTTANSNNPLYIENWYLAVWGYNSGVYPNNGGDYGVGWLNNPANPTYPPTRQPFLRGSLDDAAEPWKWPYQEKVMGWAETPQWQWIDPFIKYSEPDFGETSGGRLSLPDRRRFCSSVNNCNPDWPDPCPAWNSSCWWHGNVSWQTGSDDFATENLAYSLGSSEPTWKRVFQPACTRFPSGSGVLVVDDLTDTSDNILCGGGAAPWGGKFTLRTGSPSGSVYSDYAEVDLHQIPGYLGHSWFTHTYDAETERAMGTDEHYRKVVGTWTPNITEQRRYSIVAHLPSRGTLTDNATYIIHQNWGSFTPWECDIEQSITDYTDTWIYLGTYTLAPGARVQLDNIDYRPAFDAPENSIAYDAMAFVPTNNDTTHPCGTLY